MENLIIKFTNINISSIASNSGVFTGTNSQLNWQLNKKSNLGLGEITGYNNIARHIANVINDNDVNDADFSSHMNYQYQNQPLTQS
ncbi:hypothetical protein [Peribacillus alkalitolerans]|uniref:hypothetical protein n=1 Tax=Peribacillus alkalitolerans TaxID=1550385 RepID=UPI0013CF7552|nr:hypothetical protein [Peribacillus alkalitolerans]